MLAIVAEHADLDQFVDAQRTVGFVEYGARQPGVADHHDRVEVVRARPQRLAICGIQHDGKRKGRRAHLGSGRSIAAAGEFASVGSPSIETQAGLPRVPMNAMRERRPKADPGVAASPKKPNRSNKAWMARHIDDPYVRLAQKHGYRSRAAFKLIEIDRRDRLLRPGISVVDLGAAPGAWSQVLRERLARPAGAAAGIDGRIVALDLLPMEPIADVVFVQGDIRDEPTLRDLEAAVGGAPLDLVISDMAPNLSGVAAADAARMSDLAELAVEFAMKHLKDDGGLLVKCFHGSGYSQIVELFRRSFVTVAVRKPEASRSASAETYLLGRRPRRPPVG